ncbi:Unknown protein [Striga hermonthica]|uniref:Uncharacterized protein n=1 Tax=Striga hermonthica TaxID=68872 RepID=A0A9N7MZS4_STRHE|nr:Unknown protein [Striga hermonthica]
MNDELNLKSPTTCGALPEAHNVQEIVENEYEEPPNEVTLSQQQKNRLRDLKKIAKKDLFLIQQALGNDDFEKISSASTAKKSWNKLQVSCKGAKQVKNVCPNLTRSHRLNIEEKENFTESKDEANTSLLLAYKEEKGRQDDTWFLDTGASNHMCGKRSMSVELDVRKRECLIW